LRAQATSLSAEQLELLAGLNNETAHLGLAPIPQLPEAYRTAPRLFSEAPSFRDFSLEMALPLKAGLWSDVFRDQSRAWAEKLVRFCEVHCAELPRRAGEKWLTRRARHRGVMELAVLFLEANRAVNDLRYVNTALKLFEVRTGWPGVIDLVCILLSIRAAVQCEAALRRLETAK
jgi:hypothetical protein